MKTMYKIIKPTNKKRNFFDNHLIKILIVLVVVSSISFFDWPRSFLSGVFSPLFNVGGYFYQIVTKIPKNLSPKEQLLAENKDLSEKLENNNLIISNYEVVKHENEELRKGLGLKPLSSSIAAKVISRPPQIPFDSLFIGKGFGDGMVEGGLVLAADRLLIGRIVEVSKNKATVALNSFPEFISHGYLDRTREPIEVTGLGGSSMQAKVPIDFDIKEDDKIMTEGNDIFIIGVVAQIESNPSQGFKKVLIYLPTDISKTQTVFVEQAANN